MDFVTIHHPETGGYAEVSGDDWTLDHYAERGWRPVTVSDDPAAKTVPLVRDGVSVNVPADQAADWQADGWAADVPDGTVDEVLAWVGDDPGRAALALQAEQNRPTPRVTLIDQLTTEE